jgi:pantothenate kinase
VVVGGVRELARRVEELAARRAPARTVLGIAGPPGCGKSTLAARLVGAVAPEAVVVPMDGFHLAQAELERLGSAGRKGAPDTFDAAGYVALLRRLRDPGREVVYAPAFDRDLEEPVAGSIAVRPDLPLVVTEGNYLGLEAGAWAGVRQHLDELWFVDVDRTLRIERLVARHVRHGRSPAAAARWVETVDEVNTTVVDASRGRADLVVRMAVQEEERQGATVQ